MKAQTRGPGVGLYFIDILACTLFCLSLALVGARFSRETAIEVDLPRAQAEGRSLGALDAQVVSLRAEADGTQFYWGDEPLSRDALHERLRRETPDALVVRMGASDFTALVADAMAAGVRDIQIAYDAVATPAAANAEETR